MAFTPVARQLKQRLEDRRGWFRSWLFQWHRLGDGSHPVEVDLFNGKMSYLGGIAFDGSARHVFWDAITRGVRKEILEQFAWVDEQVRRYNRQAAIESVDQAAGLLIAFGRGVRRDAIEKDRILRGDGIKFPAEEDAGFWDGSSETEIKAYAESLKAAWPNSPSLEDTSSSASVSAPPAGRFRAIWEKNRLGIEIIGLVSAIAGLLALFW